MDKIDVNSNGKITHKYTHKMFYFWLGNEIHEFVHFDWFTIIYMNEKWTMKIVWIANSFEFIETFE